MGKSHAAAEIIKGRGVGLALFQPAAVGEATAAAYQHLLGMPVSVAKPSLLPIGD